MGSCAAPSAKGDDKFITTDYLQQCLFDTAESVCVASVARTVLRAVRDTVVSVARAVWNWIFF